MSDIVNIQAAPVPVPVPVTQAQTDTTIQGLSTDVVQAITDVKKLIAAYEQGKLAAVGAALPSIIPDIERDYEDVKAALPTIKTGYATTEFWITLVVDGIITYLTAAGKVPPMDGAATIAALTAVYTVVRGHIKNNTPTVTTVAAKPVAATK